MDTLVVDGTRVNNMKNLINKKGDKVVRVPDKKKNEVEAILDLLEEGWKYCPNQKWREYKNPKKTAPKKAAKKKGKKKAKGKK